MRIMIIVLIAVLSNQLYSQPPQWSLYLTASAECANSQNGTITVTMQLGQTVPNVGPYQLPWDVSYEEINNGDFGTEKMFYNGHQIRMLKKGTYKVTVYFNNECYAEGIVEVPEEPNTLAINTSVYDKTCEDYGAIVLNVTGGTTPLSYLWTDGSTNNYLTDLEIGTYCYTVTDINGCIKNDCSDVGGDVDKPLNITFDTYNVIPNVQNGKILFTGTDNPELTFWWTGPDNYESTEKNLTNLNPGIYCVKVNICNQEKYSECYTIFKDCGDLITNIETPNVCEESKIKIILNSKNDYHITIYQGVDGGIIKDYNLIDKDNDELVLDKGYYTIIVRGTKIPFCKAIKTFIVNDVNFLHEEDVTIEELEPSNCPTTKGKFKVKVHRPNGEKTFIVYFPDVNTLLNSDQEYEFDFTSSEYKEFDFYDQSNLNCKLTILKELHDHNNQNLLDFRIEDPICPTSTIGKFFYKPKNNYNFQFTLYGPGGPYQLNAQSGIEKEISLEIGSYTIKNNHDCVKNINFNIGYGGNLTELDFRIENPICPSKLGKLYYKSKNNFNFEFQLWSEINGQGTLITTLNSEFGIEKSYLLPVGKYFILDNLCYKQLRYFEIDNSSFTNPNYTLEIQEDDINTPIPDGSILLRNITPKCPNQKYILSKNKDLTCEDINLNGKPFQGLYIDPIQAGRYYLYIFCGGCCSKEEIDIPLAPRTKLSITDLCFDPYAKIKLNGVDENCTAIWSNGTNSKKECLVTSPGLYSVTITCPGSTQKVEQINVPASAEVVVDYVLPIDCENVNPGKIKVHIKPNSGFSPPYTYEWYEVGHLNVISTAQILNETQSKWYKVKVTDIKGCTSESVEIFLPCCDINSSTDCIITSKKNPSSIYDSDGFIEACPNTNRTYNWFGPNGFRSNQCCIYNLKSGSYLLKYEDKQKGDVNCSINRGSKTIYLAGCDQESYNIEVTTSPYCNIFDKVKVTVKIKDIKAIYGTHFTTTVTINGEKKYFTWPLTDKITFELDAYDILKAIVYVNTTFGCQKTYQLNLKSSRHVNTYKDLNHDKPQCYTKTSCTGKDDYYENHLVVDQTFVGQECQKRFMCDNQYKIIQGEKKSYISKEQGICFQYTYCEFKFEDETIKYPEGQIVQVDCPIPTGESTPITKQKEIYPDGTGCIFIVRFKCTGCPSGYYDEKQPGVLGTLYCYDQFGNCQGTQYCGTIEASGFVPKSEGIILEEEQDPNLCAGKKDCVKPPGLTKTPTDIYFSPIDGNFYVTGYFNGTTELFFKKYDPQLNNTLNTNLQFNTDGNNPSSISVNSLVDNGNILQVSSTTFGNVTIEGNTTTLIDGNTRLINVGRDLNIISSNNLPYNGWQQVISQKTSNTGQKLMLIKGSTNLNNTPQVGQVDSGQLYLVNYLPSGFVNSTIPISSNSLYTIAGFDLMSSGQAVVAYSSLAGIVLNVVSNSQIVQSSLIPMPITSTYKTLDVVTSPNNIFVLMTLPTQNSTINSMLIKMDNNLNIIWSKQFEGGLNVDLSKIAYYNDQLVVTGNFSGEYVLPTGDTLNSIGMDPLALVLDMGGNIINYVTGSGTGDDMAVDLTITPSGKAVLMGCYKGSSLTIGDKLFDESDPLNKIFVFGFTLNTPIPIISDSRIEAENDLINITKVYPNPTNGDLNVEISSTRNEKNVSITIYDMNGKKIYLQQIDIRRSLKSSFQVSSSGISAGFYYLILEDQKGNKIVKKFGKF